MEIDIKEYIAPLRKWWWFIALTTLVAAASSYLATRQQTLVYRSNATVMIGNAIDDPNPSNAQFTTAIQLASTYVDFANRASVRSAVRENLGLNFLPTIDVRQLNDTNMIDVTVTDTNPQRAQAVAAELVSQLILRSPTGQEEGDEFVHKLLAEYEAAIRGTEDQIATKREELGELVSASEIARVQEEIATLESNKQTLSSTYASLRSSTQQGATNAIRVIEPASLPSGPVTSNNWPTVLIAATVGFVLSASAAYLLEYLDDTIKTPDTITRLAKLPTLAGIAKLSMEDSKLVTISKPRAPTSEAFRVLRTALQFSTEGRDDHVLLVTSAVPEEGKSTVASNLAVVIAQAGYNVVLVDGDLRRPSQHDFFELPNKRGLTTLLLQADTGESGAYELEKLVSETVQATRVAGLQVLASGPLPPNPSELLGSTKMELLIKTLKTQFDFIILDSPPVLSVTDAVVLGTKADSALLVVKADRSRKEYLRQAIERLHEVNATVVGCVLNALTPKSEGYKYYYYYQDPYYSYDDEDGADTKDGGGPTARLRKRLLRGQTV